MEDCKNIANCGLIKTCANSEKALALKGFVTLYCKGEKQTVCKRKEYEA